MKVSIIVLLTFILCVIACGEKRQHQLSALAVIANDSMIHTNLNTYVDFCWNKHDTTLLSQIATENFTRNLNGIPIATTKREMQAHMSVFFKAFPDLELKLGKSFTKDNTVFLHWTTSGTHTGVYGEVSATGKKVQVHGLSQLYFDSEGKLYAEDVVFNELDLLQQLGYTLNLPVVE